jgi:hypothetical protein
MEKTMSIMAALTFTLSTTGVCAGLDFHNQGEIFKFPSRLFALCNAENRVSKKWDSNACTWNMDYERGAVSRQNDYKAINRGETFLKNVA